MEPANPIISSDELLCLRTTLPVTLSAAQCAQLLHCAKTTVEELCENGDLPATKIGRGWVLVTTQFLAHLSARCEREAAIRRERHVVTPVKTTLRVAPEHLDRRAAGRPRKQPPALSSTPGTAIPSHDGA